MSPEKLFADSPLGRGEVDSAGSPIGVARVAVDESYAGTGELLQKYIDEGDTEAWQAIRRKIDLTFRGLDVALGTLEAETGFGREVRQRLENGQKLFFKPNLVNAQNIHPQTHGPDAGNTACTEWPFIAALMRWFHDKIGVRYHQMALGEAATSIPALAAMFSLINPAGKKVTPEAVIEGRSDEFYGGWGFYFVRKYLSETEGAAAQDDPMSGYAESVAGAFIPPGHVSGKLMVYDLNRIFDDLSKGRACEVSDGINYKSITLHKVIVGGRPGDREDRKAYPGCVLVNVPKFKVHNVALFTNVIKNLGVGLYPMQHSSAKTLDWDYSVPRGRIPGMKGAIPHSVWVAEMNPKTSLPQRDGKGAYIVRKTGGITATMIDIVKAVADQGVFMVHVVDGIEAINVDHQGIGLGEKSPEGMIFAGLDPVATDTLCARYMFSNVPLAEALNAAERENLGTFLQKVPIATVSGENIVSAEGYDSPLSRDDCLNRAEARGLGQMKYYVTGRDLMGGLPLVSVQGHLGMLRDGAFEDLVTKSLFYGIFKVPWDLQKTTLSYMAAVDQLEGASLRKDFLEAFDEDGDGVVRYGEYGKKGFMDVFLNVVGEAVSEMTANKLGYLRGQFNGSSRTYRASDKAFNVGGHDAMKEFYLAAACSFAFTISRLDVEMPDPFLPGLVFGKGKWPSFQLARYFQAAVMLYGRGFPTSIGHPSMYTHAFFYADLTQNGGDYAGHILNRPEADAVGRYMADLAAGKTKPLDFTLYVPAGFETLNGVPIPNVEATGDPARVFTASFSGGKEVWPEPELLV
jgi:hypothetical protein